MQQNIDDSDNTNLMAEINITPFVDVMLVLLIIFIVTTPMLQQGVEIELPKTKQVKSLEPKQNHTVISISKKQNIYINDSKVPLISLEDKIIKIIKTNPNQEIYLRADKNIEYGFVIKIMAIVKSAGVKKLGMVTELNENDDSKN